MGQNSELEIKQKDLLAELQQKERQRLGLPPLPTKGIPVQDGATIHSGSLIRDSAGDTKLQAIAALARLDADDDQQENDEDEDESEEEAPVGKGKRKRASPETATGAQTSASSASDSEHGRDSDGSDSDDDDEEDEEEDTAALLRELEKIRAERAAEKEAQERAKAREEEAERSESVMRGNPLMHLNGDPSAATPDGTETSSQTGFQVQRK